ncbi:hypothetical protein B9479_006315 [Cryptococcus floricola]|uniref:Nudix hydrolase domain-containing protein n=1 Tax=Cryptococcus floricola TaxID=2591691 RepID=A0A5D3ASF6_9TREE|nr:hypothetical protein B9479_006315 [Cryptococcus floricola]
MPPPELSALRLHRPPFAAQTPVSGWPPLASVKPWHTEYTLVFVVDRTHSRFLLGHKKRGMGCGLYNGYGGKPEASETMLDCAIRELQACRVSNNHIRSNIISRQEESGLVTNKNDIRLKGLLLTSRPTSSDNAVKSLLRIHIYECTSWSGDPIETEEMAPEWFTPDNLPLERMWPEARKYVPVVLDSILHGASNDLFLARVDYAYLTAESAPTALPPLHAQSVLFEEDAEIVRQPMERLSGWYMTFTGADNLLKFNATVG